MFTSLMTFGLMLKTYDHMTSSMSATSIESISNLGQVQERFQTFSNQVEQFRLISLDAGMSMACREAVPPQPKSSSTSEKKLSIDLNFEMTNSLSLAFNQLQNINDQATKLASLLLEVTANFNVAANALIEQGAIFNSLLSESLQAAIDLFEQLKTLAQETTDMVDKLRKACELADGKLGITFNQNQQQKNVYNIGQKETQIAVSLVRFDIGAAVLNQIKQLVKPTVTIRVDTKSFHGAQGGGPALGKDSLPPSGMTTLWDAFVKKITDALKHVQAMVREATAKLLNPMAVALDRFVRGPLSAFIERHQTLAGVLGTSAEAAILVVVGLDKLGKTAKKITDGVQAIRDIAKASKSASDWLETYRASILSLISAKLTWVRANILSAAGLRGLAGAFAGSFITGIRGAILAVRAFSLALLTNPIGLVVALITGAAFLIYKYWKPIKAFFSGVWEGLKAGLAPLMPAFRQFGKAAIAALLPIVMPVVLIWKGLSRLFDYIKSTPAFRQFAKWASDALSSILAPLKAVWNWLSHIFDQVEDTGGAARNMGVAVGQGIARAIAWVLQLGKKVMDLRDKFFDAGADIVQGLWEGIKAFASHPVDAIKAISADIIGAFKGLLGIQSPSRVFMGFGDNIGEGAAIGIESSLPRIRKAADGLAGAGLAGANLAGPALGAAPIKPVAIGVACPVLEMARANPVAVGPVSLPSPANRASAAAGAVTVNFNPVIHVSGGEAGAQIKSALADGYREFEANMRRFMAEHQRRSYQVA